MTAADKLRADLMLDADAILSMIDRVIDTAQYRSEDPSEMVAAFFANQFIEVRRRALDYIAAVAQREANRTAQEAAIREAMASAVIAANTRDPQGYSRVQTFHVHGQELALIPDDEPQFEQALNVVHLEHKGKVR